MSDLPASFLKRPAVISFLLALAILGCVAFLTDRIVNDAIQKNESRTNVQREQFEKSIQAERLHLAETMSENLEVKARSIQARADQIESKINAQITSELKGSGTLDVIKARARERVDAISSALIQQRFDQVAGPMVKDLSEKMVLKSKQLEERLAKLETGVSANEGSLKQINQTAERAVQLARAISLIIRAESDDYPAYRELKQITTSKDVDVAKIAQSAVDAIDARFADRGMYESLSINDSVGDPTYDHIIGTFNSDNPVYRRAAMDMLAEMKEKRAIDPILAQLQKETNLRVIQAGTRALMQITGETSDPLDVARWISWREKKKEPPK